MGGRESLSKVCSRYGDPVTRGKVLAGARGDEGLIEPLLPLTGLERAGVLLHFSLPQLLYLDSNVSCSAHRFSRLFWIVFKSSQRSERRGFLSHTLL